MLGYAIRKCSCPARWLWQGIVLFISELAEGWREGSPAGVQNFALQDGSPTVGLGYGTLVLAERPESCIPWFLGLS